jgi:4-hydroxybenzoate polyprenyltransferase
VKQDTGFKKSLPMLLSEKKVVGIVFFYYLVAIAAVYLPVLLVGFASIYFISIVSVANLLFLLSFAKAVQRKFGRAQALSKIAMLVALIGFLAGVL